MKLRNITKRLIAPNGPLSKILLGIILMIMFSPTAFAQQFKCEELNLSELKVNDTVVFSAEEAGKNAKKLENYIITILEEEIGSSSSSGTITPNEKAAESMTCFRITKCTTANNKTTCTSGYASYCDPGTNIFCQRVQVLISQSGIDLLMSYLGIIYRWAASVIGIVSVAYLIYGGFLIGTAQDDTSKIDKAKEKIFQSIAGLVLLFLSAVILYTINPNFFTL